jgi:hypothetical protein
MCASSGLLFSMPRLLGGVQVVMFHEATYWGMYAHLLPSVCVIWRIAP